MSLIDVVVVGNGTAWVDNPDPVLSDTVTLYATPDIGETLDDIEAWDSYGYSVALYVQQVQTFTWTYDAMTIKVTFSTATPTQKIFITTVGDGTAFVSNDSPHDGDTVTLDCIPDPRRKIESIEAVDKFDNPITLQKTDTQVFIWDDTWEEMYITVTFVNDMKHHMPIWMYPCLRG